MGSDPVAFRFKYVVYLALWVNKSISKTTYAMIAITRHTPKVITAYKEKI